MERLSLRIPEGFRAEWGRRCERRGDTVRAAGEGLGWDFHEAGPVVLERAGMPIRSNYYHRTHAQVLL